MSVEVVLTNVPSPQRGLVRYVFPSYPPLGLTYLAAVLENAGSSAHIIDLEHERVGTLLDRARREKPKLIGVSAAMPMLKPALRLAAQLRKAAPSAILIVGGPLTVCFAHRLVSPGAFDAAVIGEAEHLIEPIVQLARAGRDSLPKMGEIPGVVVRDGERLLETPPGPPPSDLDALPAPAYHLLSRRSLLVSHPATSRRKATAVITSRGCLFNCSFCYEFPFKKLYRTHSVAYVTDLILELKKRYGITFIRFLDDLFTCDRERTLELCEAFATKIPTLRWHCGTRADLIDEELAKVMYRAGCRAVNFGIETGNKDDLKRISKGLRADPRQSVELCVAEGIDVIGQFIVGFPWDDRRSILERIAFAKSLPLRAATFFPLIPFPGTRIFDQASESFGEFQTDFAERVELGMRGPLDKPVYSPRGMTLREMDRLVRWAQISFHLRPKTLLPLAARWLGLTRFSRD